MAVLYLGIVFLVIILLLVFHCPLYQALIGGLLAKVLLFHIPMQMVLTQVMLFFFKLEFTADYFHVSLGDLIRKTLP